MEQRPRARRYVRCVLCDKVITLNNFSTHLKNFHHDNLQPRKDLYVETDQPSNTLRRRRRPVAELPAAPAVELSSPIAVAAPGRAVPGLPPLGLDDLDTIVLTVADQLAEPTGLLPVAHLSALFAWREATATFLRSVSREPSR